MLSATLRATGYLEASSRDVTDSGELRLNPELPERSAQYLRAELIHPPEWKGLEITPLYRQQERHAQDRSVPSVCGQVDCAPAGEPYKHGHALGPGEGQVDFPFRLQAFSEYRGRR